MRIAILADRLVMGGLETHIISLTNELLKRGRHLLLNAAYINPDILRKIIANPDNFHHRIWSDNPIADVEWFLPDIIHAHPFTAIYRGYEVATALHKPMVVTMHGLYDFGLDRSPLGNKISTYVDTIIAVDPGVADLLRVCTSHPEKVEVIYNGIDLSTYFPHSNKGVINFSYFNLNPDHKTIVIVSRMSDGKEQPIYQMLQCAPVLAERLNGLNLIIVGDGVWYSDIRAKAEAARKESQLLNLAVTGERSDVNLFLAMSDLVLACDRAALEAMACQKTVLAMNAEGFAEVIQTENFREIILGRKGYRKLPNELIIQKLYELLEDDRRRNHFAKQGVEIVKRHFDIRNIAAKVDVIYHRALSLV